MTGLLFESDRDRAFREFDQANPNVYRLFRSLAEQVLEANSRIGARCIGERIRWEFAIKPTGQTEPKFNDLLWPRYARKLAADDARFAGFFETRGPAMQGGAA